MFYVYILISQIDATLYTGQTGDLKKRLHRHNKGLVISTKRKAPYELGYFECFRTRAEAMQRERDLKTKVSTKQKKKMISNFGKKQIEQIILDSSPNSI